LFWNVVWPRLEKIGWKLENGNRENDKYFLPAGVERGKGNRVRVHYFDSRSQVLKCLETHEKWSKMAEASQILELKNACVAVANELKNENMLPKDYDDDWLVAETKKKRPELSSY